MDVGQKQYTNERAAPELVVGDAPSAPKFGAKGLQGNTTYELRDAEQRPTEQKESHEVRLSMFPAS